MKRKTETLAQKAWKEVKAQSASAIKKEIQALLREIVILRDGGCIFRNYPEAGKCGGWRSDGELILQADHISSRGNSTTYALTDNVVCICRNHHTFWKRKNPAEWTDITRKHIGVERFDRMISLGKEKARHSYTTYDWGKIALGLKDDLKKLSLDSNIAKIEIV